MSLDQIAQNFGFAALCLAVFALAVWRAGIAIFNRVGVPLVEAHRQYLESQSKQSVENTELLKRNTEIQDKLADTVSTLANNINGVCKYQGYCENYKPRDG